MRRGGTMFLFRYLTEAGREALVSGTYWSEHDSHFGSTSDYPAGISADFLDEFEIEEIRTEKRVIPIERVPKSLRDHIEHETEDYILGLLGV